MQVIIAGFPLPGRTQPLADTWSSCTSYQHICSSKGRSEIPFLSCFGKKIVETIDTRRVCVDSALCVFVGSLCEEATEILIAFCFVRHHSAVVRSLYPLCVPKTHVA